MLVLFYRAVHLQQYMNKNKFEDVLIDIFSDLNVNNFQVEYSIKKFFLCGGEINIANEKTPSFRDRFMRHTAQSYDSIYDAIVLAESFKDYFKENVYTDLLVFERDIANIATLVIIILESPGALVELGMFCNKTDLYKKLIIVANQKHTEHEDSFIYLGPLEYIRRKDPTSVAEYPWNDSVQKNDYDSLEDLCSVINDKIEKYPSSERLKVDNSGHISFLISEIITLCYPILIGEIELIFLALEIEISISQIQRSLYLLNKIGVISSRKYGTSYKFYYPLIKDKKTVRFGGTKSGKKVDSLTLRMAINQSFINETDQLSGRRVNVLKLINSSLLVTV
ncbi:retron St85 family effector protein [Shewanella baltica]